MEHSGRDVVRLARAGHTDELILKLIDTPDARGIANRALLSMIRKGKNSSPQLAAESLGRIRESFGGGPQDKPIVEALIKALSSNDGNTRLVVAKALCAFGETQWADMVTGDDKADFLTLIKIDDKRLREWLVFSRTAEEMDAMLGPDLRKVRVPQKKKTGRPPKRFRKYGVLTGLMKFLSFVAAISFFGVILGLGMSLSYYFSSPTETPAAVPDYIPADVKYENSSFKVNGDDTSVIVPYGESITVTVYFDERESINALWSGSNATLSIGGQEYTGDAYTDSWADVLFAFGNVTEDYTPWMKAAFKADESDMGNWVDVIARLGVTYPEMSGSGYIDEYTEISRSFHVFVVSPADYDLLVENGYWKNAMENRAGREVFMISVCVNILTFAGAILIERLYKRLYSRYVAELFRTKMP